MKRIHRFTFSLIRLKIAAGFMLWLSFLISALNYSHATEVKTLTFNTPKLLTQSKIQNREQALALLTNEKFHLALKTLAEKIPQQTIMQYDMFNKVALLSVLNKHSQLLGTLKQHKNAISFTHYALHSETELQLSDTSQAGFDNTLTQSLNRLLPDMNDEELFQFFNALGWSVPMAQDYAFNIFKRYNTLEHLTLEQAVDLIVNAHLYHVLEQVIPISQQLLAKENSKRYDITPEMLITTPDGVELAATIIKKKSTAKPLPTALQFTIYADEKSHITTAMHAAAHGYVGVVANSRGKRSSRNKISPWEYDGEDATQVINWISEQAWSNGDVVMYGGSYNGFTQWAAAKYMHPSLKAIAPYVAASLITGLPYENNIVLTGNYEWAFYATNNKTVDSSVYNNWQKSNQLLADLYKSGKAVKAIDAIDGKANPWFQKWLQHPSFDEYYQAMVPYKNEYANINIPVLSITGYFDGGQISAIDYLKRHYKYNKKADHTLLIGPYNHITAQGKPRTHHSNYALDSVALEKDTEEIVFQWFDHVLQQKPKPALLKDKVNYQLMGSNQWRHSSSYEALNKQSIAYYLLSNVNEQGNYTLSDSPEQTINSVSLSVDMTDRTSQHNKAPWPVIQDKLNNENGLLYMTPPFDSPQELAGEITGHFSIAVNKKDVDIGYNFYEITKEGQVFHLNTYRSRASYAHSMSHRKLLTPNKKTLIPIINARMTAKLIAKGSRLAIVLNVNKNSDAQVNMGSGKNVNEETIEDAGDILTLKWFNDTQLNIPLKPWQGEQ